MSPSRQTGQLASARLCAVTPDAPPQRIEELVAGWLRGGADMIQLRHKSLPRGELLTLARSLAEASARARALFIVNDHLDIALLSGADGVHLGPDDLTLAAARQVAGPDLLLGASAANPDTGRQAERDGASYLGSGPAFDTPIKGDKEVIGPAGIAQVAAAVSIPVFAIGGIDIERVPELRVRGIDRLCAIRALAEVADPEMEVRRLKDALA